MEALADGRKIEWVDESQRQAFIDGAIVDFREMALNPEKYKTMAQKTIDDVARIARRNEGARMDRKRDAEDRQRAIEAKIREGIPVERAIRGLL